MPDLPLVNRLLEGDPRALARAISIVEDEGPLAAGIMAGVHIRSGRACLLGITGPAGVGKSSLVDRLIGEYRKAGRRVAVIAVDPSSPFTGGAILGDRVRMQGHGGDAGVFIRSMATRGHLGGLARATADVAELVDAAGFDMVIVETVGVGQDEVDIVRLADVCVVLTAPETGDEVQAIKAGIMEIAHIFVVNKADQTGTDRAVAAIDAMVSLDERPLTWRAPVLRTIATTGSGVAGLMDTIEQYREAARDDLVARRRGRMEWRLRDSFSRLVWQALETDLVGPDEWRVAVDGVMSGDRDPHGVAATWMAQLRGSSRGRLDHIAIAAVDEAASLVFFRDVLGMDIDQTEEVPSQQVRVRFMGTGDTRLELVIPTSQASPVATFLSRRGSGLHHIAIRVESLSAALEHLRTCGVRLVDEVPRPGAHGTRIAFVHPASTGGVLVELIEAAGRAHAGR